MLLVAMSETHPYPVRELLMTTIFPCGVLKSTSDVALFPRGVLSLRTDSA
jgi:hypothetical protein